MKKTGIFSFLHKEGTGTDSVEEPFHIDPAPAPASQDAGSGSGAS